MSTVAITGTSGFIGGYLVKHFREAGWNVIALQRKPASSPKLKAIRYVIGEKLNEMDFSEVNLFIHCAWKNYTKQNPYSDEENVEGVKNLQQLARKTGAGFIFLSTLSAHDEAVSHYGISKLHAEQIMDSQKGLVLKLGLVIGSEGGLFQKIAGIIKKSKIIPMVDGGRQPMQTIWIEDLFGVIIKSYEQGLTGNFAVAESGAITMKQLYEMIGKQLGLKPVFLSIPYPLVYFGMKIAENLLPLQLTTENLKGLKQLRAFDTTAIQQKLSITFSGSEETIRKILAESKP